MARRVGWKDIAIGFCANTLSIGAIESVRIAVKRGACMCRIGAIPGNVPIAVLPDKAFR